MATMTPHSDPRRRLLSRMRRLCEQAAPWLAPVRDALPTLADELDGPFRLAVVGRVKAGKSTLVNALLGRRIAPTRAGECTQVVTWYRFGSPDRAELTLQDGSREELQFTDRLPEDLPVPVEAVRRLDVWLRAGPLRGYTLIDTPGLASMTAGREEAVGRELLGTDPTGVPGMNAADAMLFLVRDVVRAVDVEFLTRLAAATRPDGAIPYDTIGVLSHADVFADGPWGQRDPIDVASEHASSVATRHRTEFAAVLVVSGLLAEASRTGRLTGSSTRALARLAGAAPTKLRLWRELGPPEGVSVDELEHLERHFGPYALARGRETASAGPRELGAWMAERSGIASLEEHIARRFVEQADVLKSRRVLWAMRRVARPSRLGPDGAARLIDLLEEAEADPALHRLREADAAERLGGVAKHEELTMRLAELLAGNDAASRLGLAGEDDVGRLRDLARQRASAAQARVTTSGDPTEAEAARVLSRSYQLLASDLT